MNTNRIPSPFYANPGRQLMPSLLLPILLVLAVPCAAQTCDYSVSSLADSGTGSLRAGLADTTVANICFGVQGTITLSSPLQVVTPVTISANGVVTISGNNQVGIFVISPSLPTDAIRINGFTLTNGNATAGNNIYGGAVWVQQGNVTLVGTSITSNTATSGGGIYNSGTLLLTGCGITNNTTTNGTGGGIYNSEGASLSLASTTVSGNSAGTSGGGGLDNYGTAQVVGGTFSNNQGYQGGAILNESGGQLPISQGTTFSNNLASLNGGAIYNVGSTTTTQALFNGNQAQGVAEVVSCGGAFCNQGTATISESTFSNNTTTGSGGAIETQGYAILTLNDVTISANTAGVLGSGLDIESLTTPTINNSIIAGNTAIPGAVISDCNGCTASNGAANLIGVTVNLGPLASNGGPTETMMPLPGGAAIAAGDATAAAGEDVDQRGFSRFNSNGTLDVGAVQTHYASVAFVAQPSNAVVSQTITPAVAVRVVETDGATTNYPSGVPVTLSLLDAQSSPVSGALTGTLTQYPANNGGVIEALFADLSVNTTGIYKLFATDAISGNSSSANPAYSATSNTFDVLLPITLAWQPAPLPYGPMPQSELNATATINGTPATGAFVYTFVTSAATINIGQIYPVGTYQVQVTFTPTGSTIPYTLKTTLQVNRATPVLTWPTPAPIFTVTPLSGTQLSATAAGVNGASLPGTFVYSPTAGATLPAGPQTLSTTFTPTDAVDYNTATAQVTIQVSYARIAVTSVSPGTASLGTAPLPFTITGTGFTPTAEVEINGTAVATTVVSSTALSASIPAANLAQAATLSLSVYDPASKFTSNVYQFVVTAPTPNMTFSIPSTASSGEQPTITIGLNSPYPSDLQGALALTFAPNGNNGIDDPAIQFSTGGRTLNFTVPANSTTTPQVALQTGTVAGTITVTLTLTAGGVDVTPAGLTPITLVIAASAPVITSVSFTNNDQGQITVVVSGFSNTREVSQAEFVFSGSGAGSLRSSRVDVSATGLFAPWYSSSASDQFGSEFTYTQNFQLSKPDAGVTGVAVTLANSVGTSGSANSQ
jgi:predicted outer membrane repeat protein